MPPLLRTIEGSLFLPILYGFGMIAVFAVLYRSIGVTNHFVVTEEQQKKPWFASFYISAMAQSNAMGDSTPKTILGRSLFATQCVLGWMWMIVFASLVDYTVMAS